MASSASQQKEFNYKLHNLRGGVNYALPQHAIRDDQAAETSNLIFESGENAGFTFAPGYLGVDTTEQFTGKINFAGVHRAVDGTETIIVVAGTVVNTYDTTTKTATPIYNFGTAAHQCFASQMFGKLFLCNGVDTIKIEKVGSAIVAYKVGIVAPVGPTVTSGGSGGTLAAGVYTVYISYSSALELYSYPTICAATATITADQILTITCPNSADPQVTTKVAWVVEPSGTVAYFYKSSGNNTSTTFTITSAANKDINTTMLAEAASIYRPPVFKGVFGFDNRLYGWQDNDNILYYSVKGNAYDCEKFVNPTDDLTGYRREIQANIVSLFALGGDLYVNTVNGVFQIPKGDTSAKILPVETHLYFKYPHTVVEYENKVFGLTQDGWRFFSGGSYNAGIYSSGAFSQDLSKDIKPIINSLYADASVDYEPIGFIYRRGTKRTEYHLCFRNTTNSTMVLSGHLVLNIDTIAIQDQNNFIAAWELWTTAFCNMFSTEDGTFYGAQTNDQKGCLCYEAGSADQYFYNYAGTFITELTAKGHYLKSKLFIPDAKGVLNFDVPGGILVRAYSPFDIVLHQPDNTNHLISFTFAPTGASPVVISDNDFEPDAVFSDAQGIVLPEDYPVFHKTKWGVKQSRMAYFEFIHNGIDDNFRLYEYQQPINWERNNAT
jgi:hypothetical protein